MSRYNAAYSAPHDDCQDEFLDAPRPEEIATRKRDFREGITMDLASIEAIAGPFIGALAMVRAQHAGGNLADMKQAFEQLATATERMGSLRARATHVALKISSELLRNPRVRS